MPVLLYHGIGPESVFSNEADASYGVGFEDFAKQMTLIQHAGYQTIDLETFVRYVREESVDLPPRPLLLTFDDGRADSWTGADGILEELGFDAVMFVDVGRVEAGDPEYLTWEELETVEASDRWELQLHSGEGHQQIRYGPAPEDVGPYYAYEEEGEDFDEWRERVHSDIEWGEQTLSDRIASYEPLAFAPPTATTDRTARTIRASRMTFSAGSWSSSAPSSRGRECAGAFGEPAAARADPGHTGRHRR